MEKSVEVLRSYALDYASRLQSSTIQKEPAIWSYKLYLLPKLTFPLMALTLTEPQCHYIQSPALRALLPKLHLNRNMARSIINGPLIYDGMNLPHLYTIQGCDQLKFLLGHLQAQDKTCKLILIRHGYLQLLVGITKNFLNEPYQTFSYCICPSWLTSVWQFMSKFHLSITMRDAWLPSSLEPGDVNLMEYFVSRSFFAKQLASLNRCRVYLQVLFLSDIVSADGKTIISPVLDGHKLVDRRSSLLWPSQATPPRSGWRLWAEALQPLHYRNLLK